MTRELADDLILAVTRRSCLRADHAGLTLTLAELQRVYDKIALSWVQEKLTDPHVSTIANVLDQSFPGDAGDERQ